MINVYAMLYIFYSCIFFYVFWFVVLYFLYYVASTYG